MNKIIFIFLILFGSMIFVGCGANKEYEKALTFLDQEDYESAISMIQEIENTDQASTIQKIVDAKFIQSLEDGLKPMAELPMQLLDVTEGRSLTTEEEFQNKVSEQKKQYNKWLEKFPSTVVSNEMKEIYTQYNLLMEIYRNSATVMVAEAYAGVVSDENIEMSNMMLEGMENMSTYLVKKNLYIGQCLELDDELIERYELK